MRPLRFALALATVTALSILLGHLWLRSIDGRPTISLGQAAREGSDAVGVAITDLGRRVGARARLNDARSAAARRRTTKRPHGAVPHTTRPVVPVRASTPIAAYVVTHVVRPVVHVHKGGTSHRTHVHVSKPSAPATPPPAPKPGWGQRLKDRWHAFTGKSGK